MSSEDTKTDDRPGHRPLVSRQRPRSASSEAALYIRDLIFGGELKPGTRVPQDEVASALGLSRIPIREALIGLEREGWVTIKPHRGAFVNTFDEATVVDHYALYGLIYGFAVRRAMERSDRESFVTTLIHAADNLDGVDEPVTFHKAVMEFHRTVLDAAGSRPPSTVAHALSWLVPGDFFTLVPDTMSIERRGLRSVVNAIAASDGDQAASEYAETMRGVGECVLALFADRGLLEDGSLNRQGGNT